MPDNPYESPQTIEHLHKEHPTPQTPTFKGVLFVIFFQAIILILSALILDGGRIFMVMAISCIAMWVVIGLRWLRFRQRD